MWHLAQTSESNEIHHCIFWRYLYSCVWLLYERNKKLILKFWELYVWEFHSFSHFHLATLQLRKTVKRTRGWMNFQTDRAALNVTVLFYLFYLFFKNVYLFIFTVKQSSRNTTTTKEKKRNVQVRFSEAYRRNLTSVNVLINKYKSQRNPQK